jgi:hypothetical protein
MLFFGEYDHHRKIPVKLFFLLEEEILLIKSCRRNKKCEKFKGNIAGIIIMCIFVN